MLKKKDKSFESSANTDRGSPQTLHKPISFVRVFRTSDGPWSTALLLAAVGLLVCMGVMVYAASARSDLAAATSSPQAADGYLNPLRSDLLTDVDNPLRLTRRLPPIGHAPAAKQPTTTPDSAQETRASKAPSDVAGEIAATNLEAETLNAPSANSTTLQAGSADEAVAKADRDNDPMAPSPKASGTQGAPKPQRVAETIRRLPPIRGGAASGQAIPSQVASAVNPTQRYGALPTGPSNRVANLVGRPPQRYPMPVQTARVQTPPPRTSPLTGNRELSIPNNWLESNRSVIPVASEKPLQFSQQPMLVDNSVLFGDEDEGDNEPDEPILNAGDGGAEEDKTNDAPKEVVLPDPVRSKTVSLRLDHADVHDALEMLSRQGNLNILIAPNVTGTVNASFEGIGIEKALGAILKLCKLVAHREDGLIYVFTETDVPQLDLRVRVFPLDFSSADDLIIAVQGMLSPAGKAFANVTNQANNRQAQEVIVVTDVHASIERIAQYIMQMDQAPRQVMIEAHVLSVALTGDLRHGVNYKQLFALGGSTFELNITGLADTNASPALFAQISGADVDGLLELLKTTTDAKTLASPKVMVVNGQKGKIQVGEQLGYKNVTVTETAAVEDVQFLDVGIVLEVTPQISRDGRILMRVKPKVSSGRINPETKLPEEETAELETDVLVESGQGVVIGGLIQEKLIDVQSKVPWFGDLRHFGKLFKRKSLIKERSEIIVTLVPRIVTCPVPCTEKEAHDAMRCQTPLLEGPLRRYPRPWEPSFPVGSMKFWGKRRACGCGSAECIDCNAPFEYETATPIPADGS